MSLLSAASASYLIPVSLLFLLSVAAALVFLAVVVPWVVFARVKGLPVVSDSSIPGGALATGWWTIVPAALCLIPAIAGILAVRRARLLRLVVGDPARGLFVWVIWTIVVAAVWSRDFWIAGSLVLMAAALLRLGIGMGVFSMPPSVAFGHLVAAQSGVWESVAALVSAFFSMNLLLAVFNLLPLPPLDGSGAAPLLLNASATRGYQRFLTSTPALGLIGMLLAWQVFSFIFNPIFLGAVNLLYPGAGYR